MTCLWKSTLLHVFLSVMHPWHVVVTRAMDEGVKKSAFLHRISGEKRFGLKCVMSDDQYYWNLKH